MLSIVVQPSAWPVRKPASIITLHWITAVMPAVGAARNSLPTLNSSPSPNIRRITPQREGSVPRHFAFAIRHREVRADDQAREDVAQDHGLGGAGWEHDRRHGGDAEDDRQARSESPVLRAWVGDPRRARSGVARSMPRLPSPVVTRPGSDRAAVVVDETTATGRATAVTIPRSDRRATLGARRRSPRDR